MLKITKDRTFKKTVRVALPSATKVDGVEKVEFIAVFKAISQKEVDAYRDATSESGTADIQKFLRQIIVGVEGVGDEAGNPMEPEDALEAILDDVALCTAAVDVFNATNTKAKAGN